MIYTTFLLKEACCVLCDVRTTFIYISQVHPNLHAHNTDQVVSRCPLTAEAGVRSQVGPCEIMVDNVVMGQFFLRVLWSLLVSIISKVFRAHIYLHVASTRKNKTGNVRIR
jgi:hypothetical protein